MNQLTLYTDGACKGVNGLGPASSAFVAYENGQECHCEFYVHTKPYTNNCAEYHALVMALTWAVDKNAQSVQVFSDSELLVRQMNGFYRVKHENMKPLYEKACALRRKIAQCVITWVPREHNVRADELCNIALQTQDK